MLCASLLNVADDRVKKHDGEDGDGLIQQGGVALKHPELSGDKPGSDQKNGENVPEMAKKPLPCRDGLFRRQPVLSVSREPRPRFLLTQAGLRIDTERCQSLVDIVPMRLHPASPGDLAMHGCAPSA